MRAKKCPHITQDFDAATIAGALGGRRSGNGWLCTCPAHEDHRPSLSISDGRNGFPVVFCFAGCEQGSVIGALRARGLWVTPERSTASRNGSTEFRSHPGRPKFKTTTGKINKRAAQALRCTWAGSVPLTTPKAEPGRRYLEQRLGHELPESLYAEMFAVLRFHPNLPYYDARKIAKTYPALVAVIVDPGLKCVCIHRIYLTHDGQKAPVPCSKKLMRPIRPHALRGATIPLSDAGEKLAVAEGIETALAVRLGTGLPTWATINAGGMTILRVPEIVQAIYIMADLDSSGAGEKAAKALAYRMIKQGRDARICVPPGPIPADQKSVDWLDVYRAERHRELDEVSHHE